MTAAATRRAIVAAARGLLGTPFHHQGRVPGPRGGIDCVGVVVCALQAAGVAVSDFTAYPRTPNGTLLEAIESRFARLGAAAAAQPGDMLLYRLDQVRHPWHVAILAGDEVIHARADARGLGVIAEPRARWQHNELAAFDLLSAPARRGGG